MPRKKTPPNTPEQAIRRAGGYVDAGKAGNHGASVVVTPQAKTPGPKIAGRRVTFLMRRDFPLNPRNK